MLGIYVVVTDLVLNIPQKSRVFCLIDPYPRTHSDLSSATIFRSAAFLMFCLDAII